MPSGIILIVMLRITNPMPFNKSQRLDIWSDMIGKIYDGTQNYSKSEYEILCHLTEVSGAFGKLLFKKHDYDGALEFLPKMLVWAITLFRKVKGATTLLEEAILIKYPGVCAYCLQAPCICWRTEKPHIDPEKVSVLYKNKTIALARSLDGFQMMFRKIYGESWGLDNPEKSPQIAPIESLRVSYIRLIEELSEAAEAIRFHHLYPSNFNNELADYFAWWFAITTNYHRLYNDDRDILFAEEILWNAYPGYCLACGLSPCDCRPGPVRELLSKPALNDLEFIDGLTQAENQYAYDNTLHEIAIRLYPVALPISCIRIDIDDFKKINNEISHNAGDSALKLLVTVLRQKIRPRDRIFRVGGDEFAIICQDLSSFETEGMMKRVADNLKDKKIKGKNSKDEEIEKVITMSVGITTCIDISKLTEAFNQADLAAIRSKEEGKDRITRA